MKKKEHPSFITLNRLLPSSSSSLKGRKEEEGQAEVHTWSRGRITINPAAEESAGATPGPGNRVSRMRDCGTI
jgi:hypothetical protein